MFVGFIAVIVVILIIVALMSTGATSGSGGVDQTKATKAVGEISALGQSIGFFKTTTTNHDYSGVSAANLVSAGIIANEDVVNSTTAMKGLPVASGVVAADATEAALTAVNKSIIKSKAVKGLYYEVLPGASASTFVIRTVVDESAGNIAAVGGADDGLRAAIEAAVGKLDANINTTGDGIDVVSGDVNNDGLVGITLR